ncbi:MAG: membrane protein insertase YidC [Rhodanobacter sp.]
MNQTRTFLMFALLAVSYFLFVGWQNDYAPRPAKQTSAVASASSSSAAADASVPGAIPAEASSTATTTNVATPKVVAEAASAAPTALIHVRTDLLDLTVDTRGGSLVHADLLKYGQEPRTHKHPKPAPVVLLTTDPATYSVVQSGLVSSDPSVAAADQPNHQAIFTSAKTDYVLAPDQNQLDVVLTWQNAAGLKVSKTYTFHRGSYVITVDQHIDNGADKAWQGNAYRQVLAVNPPKPGNWLKSYTDPEVRSFRGAAWYTGEKFDKLTFADFSKPKDQLNSQIQGGWAAMLRLYYVTAWIPPATETDHYSTQTLDPSAANPRYLIRSVGPTLNVAPGQSVVSQARLYLGPNIQGTLDAIAPGLDLSIDYGMFKIIAVPMHWVLSQLHKVAGNWGIAIILLVLLIKGLTWKLTAVQYRSSAKMRKLAPRLKALKERYGDDKKKMQQATMELYKKEKVNPMGGCLPMLIIMPVFYGLYFVLEYSLELRHAAFLWIPDLSHPDPLYILPIIYALVMLGTQWLNPTAAGMDPTQAKMMKAMPLLFSVMFAFFPSGLCLYYAVNGLVGLGQQWWVTHHVDREAALTTD